MSCKYFRYYDPVNQECLHDQIGFENVFTLVAIIVVPLTVPLFTASGFGITAFQNVVLTLLFKYGRKSAVAMTQPIQAAINLSSIITNLLKKTTDNKRLVDVGLAALMIPNMISGIVAGLHLKEYVPSLLGTVLIVAQLILLLLQSLKKRKQFNEIQHIPNVDQIVPNDDFIVCPDGIMIDYEDFFKKLKKSNIRKDVTKDLPKDLLELDITIDEHKVRVKDYLQENYQAVQKAHEILHGQEIPYFKLFAIGVSIFLNIVLLVERGQGTPCQTVYWENYPYQILLNLVLTVVVSFIFQHNYHPTFIIKISLLALICGFFLGIIGMGAQLLLIIALSKLKDVNRTSAEINATLPLIMVSVYSTSSIITVMNGLQFDLRGSFIMFGLAFLGQFYLNPKFKPYFPPKKMISWNILFTIGCIAIYLFMQFPKITTTPFIYQITPHPPRC